MKITYNGKMLMRQLLRFENFIGKMPLFAKPLKFKLAAKHF
jgi:hypothetical protein